MIKNKAFAFGRYLEDFTVNDSYNHSLGKTITESDNNLFSLLTMNHHPVHLDSNYASEAQHGQILVVGSLVFSLVVGLTVPDISGKAIANLGYDKVRHLNPVFIGDTIYARSRIMTVNPSKSKPDRGVVELETTGYNQDDINVLTFTRKVLIPKRDPGQP